LNDENKDEDSDDDVELLLVSEDERTLELCRAL
jgi:hypothetical protein